MSTLLVGAVLAATLGAPFLHLIGVGQVEAATQQTRSASCSAFDFVPLDSATQADFFNAKRIRAGTGGSGFFVCDPGLPSKAVVTKVQISIWDGSGSSEVKFCGLYRSGLESSTQDIVQEMAAMGPTGISEAGGFARLTDTSIQNATIDNTRFSYWIQCNLTQAGQSLGLFGADVIYTISATNG